MTHYKTLIETEWLGQWDLPPGRDVIVVIASVARYRPKRAMYKRHTDGSKTKEANKRIDIGFVGKTKHWLAGPVSHDALRRLTGATDYEKWVGHKIALYVDPNVMMGGERVGGIRVRPVAPNGTPSPDPLDNPVDDGKAEQIDRAAGREPGEDDV